MLKIMLSHKDILEILILKATVITYISSIYLHGFGQGWNLWDANLYTVTNSVDGLTITSKRKLSHNSNYPIIYLNMFCILLPNLF